MTRDKFIHLFSSEDFLAPLARLSPALRMAIVKLLVNRLLEGSKAEQDGDNAGQDRIDAIAGELLAQIDWGGE